MFELLVKYYKDPNHVVYHLVILAGIIAGIVRFRKLSGSSRIFLLLLVITPVVELVSFYCAVHYRDNRFIYNPFNLLQFSLICFAFFMESRRMIIPLIFTTFILFTIVNSIFFQPLLSSSNSHVFLLEHLFIIVLYFMYLVSCFKKTDLGPLRNYPLFWIGMGWLVFSITSIVSFGFNNIIINGSYWDLIADWVKRISNYILYLSFCIAFLLPQKSLNDITAGK